MKTLGNKGEDFAVNFLKRKGYSILARNYKTHIGEVDIIAKEGETIVFVEVKTRANDSFGYPFESVTRRKKQKMRNIALLYLKKLGDDPPVRFDILSIMYGDNNKKEIEHIVDAFEV